MVFQYILCVLFGYVIGGINPSYIIGRLRGIDIRKKGSGNAGASNAMILMGKKVGIFSAVFDIAKGAAAFLCAPLIFRQIAYASVIAGTACIIGHICPAYMKFRGGKGLACIAGIVIGIDWRFFLILLATEVALALIADYICVIPMTAAFIVPLCYGFLGSDGLGWLLHADGGWIGAAILAVASVAILLRHIQNIKRIIAGKEVHLSYLWTKDKDAEIARVSGAKNEESEQEEPGTHT